jgi:hypothetical protein
MSADRERGTSGRHGAEDDAHARARRNAWLLAAFVVACYLGYVGWNVLRALSG